MTGQRFGRLRVVSYAGNNKAKHALWNCVCDCGKDVIVLGKFMRAGRTRSCGCLHRDLMSRRFTIHGLSASPTYATWSAMWSRCSNPNQQSFARYGAIGIGVCQRWEKFGNFLRDMGERPEGTTLDRRNPFRDYEPSNCRWSTPQEQGTNKRGQIALAVLDRLVADGILSPDDLALAFDEISGSIVETPAAAFEEGYVRV